MENATKIWLQILKNFDIITLAVIGKGRGMSQEEKLVSRLLTKPVDFTYNELKKLLGILGYKESQSGKTSGSRVAFYDEETGHIIRFHKPHPKNVLKQYQLQQIIDELTARRLI